MKKNLLVALFFIFIVANIAIAADSFPVKDLSLDYNKAANMTVFQGEITNDSGKNYQIVMFKISFYDAQEKLIGAGDFGIENFKKKETVTFEGYVTKDVRQAKSYKLRLDTSY